MLRSRFLLAAVFAVVAPAVSQAAFTVSINQTSGMPSPAAQDGIGTQAVFTGGNNNTLTVTNQALTNAQRDLAAAGIILDSNSNSNFITLGQNDPGFSPTTPVNFGAFRFTLEGTRTSDQSGAMVVGSSTSTTTVSNISSDTATIVITLTENSFTLPTAVGLYNVRNVLTILGFSGSTANAALTSTSNVNTNPGGAVTSVGNSLTGAQIATPQTAVNRVFWDRTLGDGSYTVTHVVTLTLDAGSTINFQSATEVTPTPAPAGLVMFASMLPFVGLLRRRLRKCELATAA